MAPRAHIDFETASTTDLTKSGVARYCEDMNTRAWGFSYSFGDGLYYQWRPGYADPVRLLEHIASGGIVVAHNAAFERNVWAYIRTKYMLWHWPELRMQQQSCTMARAAAHGLPQDLDMLSRVLGQKQQKDKEGSLLMRKMMRPRKAADNGVITWWDAPEDVERLMLYCDQDVRTEEETDRLVPELSDYERRVWLLDQTINERGVYIDLEVVTRAVDVALIAKKNADAKMKALTKGVVKKCSEIGKLIAWINEQGVTCETASKGDHDELMIMSDIMDKPDVRKAIELRKEASKTSTAKYSKMLDCVCADGRIRHLLNYHGAGPGRWAGRLIQPQNLPRVDMDVDGNMVEFTVAALSQYTDLQEVHDLLELSVPAVLPALSKTLRACITAEPGNKLIGGDFSNVEGRINAWLAGEEWKLEAFRAYDLGFGPDLYRVAYASAFGVDISTVGKGHKRQIGKVSELACGYQGGVGAYVTMGDTYNLKPWDLVQPVIAATTAEVWDGVAAKYSSATDKHNLPEKQWTAIKIIVQSWRKAHPGIVGSWWELGDAVVAAVDQPNTPVPVYGGRVTYLCTNGWLYCRLPSGRLICYCNPYVKSQAVEMVKIPATSEFASMGTGWIECDRFFPHELQTLRDLGAEFWTKRKNVVCFWGRHPTTGQWVEKYLYGGLQCENIVQGTARCLMDHAMFRVEEAGYPIILTVHDELLSEVNEFHGSDKEYEYLMSIPPNWTEGLPIAAAAWEDKRYVK